MSKLFKKVVRSYQSGQIIFQQGADCDGIYSVQTGWVSVYKTKATPTGPVDIELVKLGPGSMFGEMGMLDQTKREASVKALEYTEVLVITRDMFETQMASLPPWIVNFIKILISRLRITNDKLTAALQQMEANGLKLIDEKHHPADPNAAAATEVSAPGASASAPRNAPASATASGAAASGASAAASTAKPSDPAKPA